MSRFSSPLTENRGAGDLVMVILLAILGGVLIFAFMTMSNERKTYAQWKQTSGLQKQHLESAIESFLQAYRYAEIQYITSLNTCPTAKPFITALVEGSGCNGNIRLFDKSQTAKDPGIDQVYNYPGTGCEISQSSSDCLNPDREILTIGIGPKASDQAQKISDQSYRFYLVAAWPEMQYTQFQVAQESNGNLASRYDFAIRGYFSNRSHLEADSRVIQENPDPLAFCPGEAWMDYPVYLESSRRCVTFAQIGGGTGLAYYRGRFFGFRPNDGRVVDLLAASEGGSMMVNPVNGTIPGLTEPVFVPYPNPNNAAISLLNVDDITLIDDQIYYVGGLGLHAELGYVDAKGNRTRICALGEMGWAQAYSGVAALSWSDPLIEEASSPISRHLGDRFATFYLKTDNGDLLTAAVVKPKNAQISCSVLKDPTLQQVEYRRTLGFDRTTDERPYYIF